MAVAVEMNFRGATIEQYDEILGKMGLTPGGSTAPGAISHWVAKTDDGLRVVDVWETRRRTTATQLRRSVPTRQRPASPSHRRRASTMFTATSRRPSLNSDRKAEVCVGNVRDRLNPATNALD